MSNLRAFCCERSVKLNKRGLLSICARDAKSRKKEKFNKKNGSTFVIKGIRISYSLTLHVLPKVCPNIGFFSYFFKGKGIAL